MATNILDGFGGGDEGGNGGEKPAFAWSAQQEDFFAAAADDGAGNVALVARAGTGKSTTVYEGMRRFGRSCVYVAFGSDIARESKEKLARPGISNGEARTSHSFGLSAIRQAYGRVEVDKEKGETIVREIVCGSATATPKPWERMHLAALKKAFGFARNQNAQTDAEIEDAIDEAGIECPIPRPQFVAQVKRAMEMSKARPTVVDFDDMIWLPVALGLKPAQVDALFVDEAQDLNLAQIALLKSALKPSGRIFAVGDPLQAIYGFRGAAAGAMDRLIDELDMTPMPLTVTYRCAKKIVAKANEICPDLQAAETADEGTVGTVDGAKLAELAKPGDFILSRTNRPLVSLCIKFMAAGVKATIAGRDIGKRLTDLIKKSKAQNVDALLAWIEAWRVKEVERLEARDRPVDAANDVAECLSAAAEGCQSVAEVTSLIERIFVDGGSNDRVVLSSTHKAKGLERDRVFVLEATYLKKRRDKKTGEWFLPQEERHLAYVAWTRAKKELYFVQGVS